MGPAAGNLANAVRQSMPQGAIQDIIAGSAKRGGGPTENGMVGSGNGREVRTGSDGGRVGDIGTAVRGRGSIAALQALEREMQLLKEKKGIVERLAKQLELEPPSDEEDDGFPLHV